MKANELMIGDWVQGNPCGQHCDRNNNTYYKIAILDIGNHCYGYSVCGSLVELKYDDVFPIPLTQEVLEKNGWMYIAEDNVFYPENLKGELPWIYYITDGNNEVFRMKDFCNLQYVHQLQHALRLCEIEKNIEL